MNTYHPKYFGRRRSGLHKMALQLVGALALCMSAYQGNAQTVSLTTVNAARGLAFGFWENGNEDQSLKYFGLRSFARVGINGWNEMESSTAGPKKTSTCGKPLLSNYGSMQELQFAHEHGESVLLALNMGYTPAISGKQAMSDCYVQDITNTQTQSAAKSFLDQFIPYMMGSIGSFSIAIDYEAVSNFNLDQPDTSTPCSGSWSQCRATRANAWANWYGILAKEIKSAAAAYNLAHNSHFSVNVVPILNGDIANPTSLINPASYPITGGSNAWITNVIGASDGLAIDDYHCDVFNQAYVTDPGSLFNALAYWQQYLSAANQKDHGVRTFTVTENGFAGYLAPSGTPTRCVPTASTIDGKYKGTAQEQSNYFSNLFSQFPSQLTRFPDLHTFSIWEIVDNPLAKDVRDQHFGMLDATDQPKTTLTTTVQSGIASMERSFPPATATSTLPVTLPSASGVKLAYTDGLNYSYLSYTPTAALGGSANCTATLTVNTGLPAGAHVVVHATNGNWSQWNMENITLAGSTASVSLRACAAHSVAKFDLYLTADQFPASFSINNLVIR